MLKCVCTCIIVHMLHVCINSSRCSRDYMLVLIWEICGRRNGFILQSISFRTEAMLFYYLLCRHPFFACMLMNGSKQSESKDGHLMVGKVCGKVPSLDQRFCLEVQGAERLCQCKLQKVKIWFNELNLQENKPVSSRISP